MKRLSAALVIFVLLTGCSTTFLAYEGRSDLIFEGTGGARTTVDGIDFWQHGDPPRAYQLIGYIKDKRGRGLISTITKEGNVAAKAKESGGDAVMVLEANQTITGYARTAFVSGNRRSAIAGAVTVPIGQSDATFAVLKYVSSSNAALTSDPYAAPQALAPALSASIPVGPTTSRLSSPSTSAPPATSNQTSLASTSSSVGSAVGQWSYPAEHLAKTEGCAANPTARLTAKGPGFETFSVICTNQDVINVRCDYGQCRSLK